MASKKVQIQIDTRADTSGAKQASDAMNKLTTVNNAASTAASTTSKQTSRVGQVASQAGFQVQDFAVQVAGGTSALTAMAQQAPQFLGVFGPGGAIAGALIAVGAVAAKVFLGMGDDAAKAKEEAEFLADAIKQTGENASRAIAEDVDFGLQKIADAASKAESYIGVLNRVATAQEDASLSQAQTAETLRQAETEIARLTGKRIDEAKEIEAQLMAEAEMRRQIAQNAINERARELDDAIKLQASKAETLEKSRQELELAKQRRQEAVAELELARQRRDELQKIVDTNPTQLQAFLGGPETRGDPRARAAAEKQLADPTMQATLDMLQDRVNSYDQQLKEQGGTLTRAVEAAANALEKASADVQVIQGVIDVEIPKIQQEFQTDQIVAQVEGIKTIAEQAATEVQSVIETVKPANEREKQAIETLKLSAQDRQITADETLRVSQALGVLDSNIRKSMGDQLVNVNKLIQTISTLSGQLQQQQNQIDNLQRNLLRGAGR